MFTVYVTYVDIRSILNFTEIILNTKQINVRFQFDYINCNGSGIINTNILIITVACIYTVPSMEYSIDNTINNATYK